MVSTCCAQRMHHECTTTHTAASKPSHVIQSSRFARPKAVSAASQKERKTPTRGPEAALPGSARPACLLLPLLLGCSRRDVPAAPLTDTFAASQVVQGWSQAVEPKVVGSWSSATAPRRPRRLWSHGSMDRWIDGAGNGRESAGRCINHCGDMAWPAPGAW
ncbi:hypothetical protein BGZ61DRAFT_219227 [Ilyonectria robusta]|uniref:uncharacterized protein n=1 Tax=Ilyonectria robusta TaxID=1079257 RepID=UPI001E8D5BFC|nr:uncharacterized protein BGZ61DRAFT_219227 [Ilyonectria robusta]KAH8706294.1 hypothetical protein BGZ61DRAFT_219227 [Ilyonectria robusta]